MSKLNYKSITKENATPLLAIENACHVHPWSEKTFYSCIGGRYFGEYAELDNELVGFYIAEDVAGEATLMDICVPPDMQGKGFGKALLSQFTEQAKEKGNSIVWLEVRAKNMSALMMYINHGFQETGRRTGYYPSNTGFGYEDAIVMKLAL